MAAATLEMNLAGAFVLFFAAGIVFRDLLKAILGKR